MNPTKTCCLCNNNLRWKSFIRLTSRFGRSIRHNCSPQHIVQTSARVLPRNNIETYVSQPDCARRHNKCRGKNAVLYYSDLCQSVGFIKHNGGSQRVVCCSKGVLFKMNKPFFRFLFPSSQVSHCLRHLSHARVPASWPAQNHSLAILRI